MDHCLWSIGTNARGSGLSNASRSARKLAGLSSTTKMVAFGKPATVAPLIS